MERDFAGAKLSSRDFVRLGRHCQHDTKFPHTFGDWEVLVATGTRKAVLQGDPVHDIAIDVDDFVAWSRRVGVVTCLDALRAYLILIRRSQHVPGGDGTAVGQESDGSPSAGAKSAGCRRPRHRRATRHSGVAPRSLKYCPTDVAYRCVGFPVFG